MKLSEKYGGHESIGYLPDSFGMSSQMPQIYHHMGLKYAFFRRGIAKHLVDREFMWESPDGTKMFTHNLHHYGNMAYPPNGKEERSKGIIKKCIDKLGDFLLSDTHSCSYNGGIKNQFGKIFQN